MFFTQKDNIFQRRTGGRSGHQIGMEVFNKNNIINLCNAIGEEAIELLSAEECPTGKMDLVLDSDQMMLQIHESIGHAIEIDRILFSYVFASRLEMSAGTGTPS